MREKAKFSKSACAKCKYHSRMSGGFKSKKSAGQLGIICNYSGVTDSTCLKSDDNGKTVYDIRGEGNGKPCKIFEKGERRPQEWVQLTF